MRFLQLAFEFGDRLGSEQLEFFGVKSRFSEHFSHDIEHIEKRFSFGLNAHAQDLAGRLDAQIGFEFIESVVELLEWHLGGPTRKHGSEHFDGRRLALERILVAESQVQRDVDGASTGFLREHRKGDPRLELALGHPRFDVLGARFELFTLAGRFASDVTGEHRFEVRSIRDLNPIGGTDRFENPNGSVVSDQEPLGGVLNIRSRGLFQIVSEQEVQSPVALGRPVAQIDCQRLRLGSEHLALVEQLPSDTLDLGLRDRLLGEIFQGIEHRFAGIVERLILGNLSQNRQEPRIVQRRCIGGYEGRFLRLDERLVKPSAGNIGQDDRKDFNRGE